MELTNSLTEAFIEPTLTMKLTTAINRYHRQLQADGKSSLTQAVYMRDLRLFKEWMSKEVLVSRITPDQIARFLISKTFTHKENGSPKAVVSLNRSKSVLRSFFRFLVDSRYVKENPARLVRISRYSRRPPAIMAGKEIRALFDTLKKAKTPIANRDALMFSILLGTGIRLGSLVAINVQDVDITQGTLRIKAKNDAEQLVFLNRQLKKLLISHRKKHSARPADPLFLSKRERRIGVRQVQFRFSYWLEKAGITRRYSIHSFRHSFATHIYEKTGDLRLTQRALGHKRIQTTEIYAQVSDGRLKAAVQSLDLTG
jgi:site-specific recombinase XerD